MNPQSRDGTGTQVEVGSRQLVHFIEVRFYQHFCQLCQKWYFAFSDRRS